MFDPWFRNDPLCRFADMASHVCRDKFGAVWGRGLVGPRRGVRCHAEAAARTHTRITGHDAAPVRVVAS